MVKAPDNTTPALSVGAADRDGSSGSANARLDLDAELGAAAQADRLANMGVLAAGIAHEINNPLAYVLTNVESLDEDLSQLHQVMGHCRARVEAQLGVDGASALLGDAWELLRREMTADLLSRTRDALDGLRRIRDVSRGLGSFARVDEAALRLVDVHQALDAAAAVASNEIRFRARLVKDYRDVPPVVGDPGRLSQIFLDLLLNAVQAIEEGDVSGNEIYLGTSWVDGNVQIVVRDSGCGIAPEQLGHVFEPFFSTKASGLGAGLGLSICHSLVAQAGGRIDVESQVGRGTRVIVRLPPASKEAIDEASSKPPGTDPPPRARLLLIDDEEPIRRGVKRILGGDHDLVAVASGEEAQMLLERGESFDLILCDLMMPGMSGMELHAWLAERDAALARRVVFISGGAFTPQSRAYLARVDNPRLDKPFGKRELQTWVAEQLALQRRRDRAI